MSANENLNVSRIQENLAQFANERDWGQFHSPKNISMALSVEASELLEIFQWLKEENSRELDEKTLEKVQEEIADVLLYSLRMADLLKINLEVAIEEKMKKNAMKYPVEKARGTSKKYDEL